MIELSLITDNLYLNFYDKPGLVQGFVTIRYTPPTHHLTLVRKQRFVTRAVIYLNLIFNVI